MKQTTPPTMKLPNSRMLATHRAPGGMNARSLQPPRYGMEFVDDGSSAEARAAASVTALGMAHGAGPIQAAGLQEIPEVPVPLPAHGGGAEIPEEVRIKMEAAFGVDFSPVRIHEGPHAEAVGALAYAQGTDIHFAPGQYQPKTPRGQELLGHELTHVVQQSQGRVRTTAQAKGVDINNDAALEREADEMGARAARGERSLGPLQQPAPTCGLQPRIAASGTAIQRQAVRGPSKYDRTAYKTHPIDPLLKTVADMEVELKILKKGGQISSWKVEGVRSGSHEHFCILHAIWQVSSAGWDREIDVVTEIASQSFIAITIRIDAGGNAVASLVSKTEPTVPAAYATENDAKTGLKARYKLADFQGEKGRNWSIDQFNKVAAAFSRLELPAEAAALEGFTLIRTDDTLQDNGQPVAALINQGGGVREVRFADRAFDGDTKSFIGDTNNAAPASIQMILHEVGHAQERKALLDAISGYNEATAKASKAREKAWRSKDKARAACARKSASKSLCERVSAAYDAIQAFEFESDLTKMVALQGTARDAVKERNTARDALPPDSRALAAFQPALAEQDEYLATVEVLLASRQAKAAAMLDPNGERSARLQRFVDFVNAKGIKPITEYADKNWPDHPEEFYAEAFSIWHADPQFLASSWPELKKWFDDGEHLK